MIEPRPNRRRLVRLVPFALLLCAGTGALEGQADETALLRGELVRNPDGTLDVSVLSAGIPSVPDAMWDRIAQGGGVAVLSPEGSPAGQALDSRLVELVGANQVRRVAEASSLPPVGAAIEADGVRLTWYRLPEADGVAILAEARAVEPEFSLRILILDSASDQEDWWGLQAALSQAGIRRVQIVSGRP